MNTAVSFTSGIQAAQSTFYDIVEFASLWRAHDKGNGVAASLTMVRSCIDPG